MLQCASYIVCIIAAVVRAAAGAAAKHWIPNESFFLISQIFWMIGQVELELNLLDENENELSRI